MQAVQAVAAARRPKRAETVSDVSRKKRKRKSAKVLIRMSPEERAAFHAAAERLDMSLSDFLRRAARAAMKHKTIFLE